MKAIDKVKLDSDNKKYKVKGYLKTILTLFILLFAFFVSVFTSSLNETIQKIIFVLICALFGFIGFFIIYGICYLISLVVYSIKAKKLSRIELDSNIYITKYFSQKNYLFKYDRKQPFSKNIQNAKSDMLDIVKDIATGFNKGSGRYYYLNYSIYDAVSVLDTTIDLFNSKITPIFKFLKAEDKPLNVVEKLLVSTIEKEETEEKKERESKNNLLKKIGSKLFQGATFIFKGVIENTINSVVIFVASKAFEVYGKSGQKFTNLDETSSEKEVKND